MSTTSIPTPLNLTVYTLGDYAEGRGTTSEEHNYENGWQLLAAMLRYQAEGKWLRPNFYAVRELIDMGAYGITWDELRPMAVEQLDEQHAGTGCGISSSDVNHTVISMAQGYTLSWPTKTAWELIGFDGNVADDKLNEDVPVGVRVKGGRTLYEAVVFNDATPGERVRLDRLVSDSDGLHVVNRYVDADTVLEVVWDAAV